MKSLGIRSCRKGSRLGVASDESMRKRACSVAARCANAGRVFGCLKMSATEELQRPQGEGSQGERLRPAAPFPHSRNLSTFQVLRELGRNPVAAFGQNGYR